MADVDVIDPRLHELVDREAAVRLVATGFEFTEGPVWHPVEQRLWFSDIPADVTYAVTADGDVTAERTPTLRGNGLALDRDLCLIVCEHVSSSVVRVRPRGVREVLAFHYEGRYLNSPNDVVVHSDGSIWFSDPWYGRQERHGRERPRELGWQGVFRIPPGGGPDDLRLVVPQDELEMPNGLCFSPDESLLYVDDTPRNHVKVFAVAEDGTLGPARVFFDGMGEPDYDRGVVDGIKCDARGDVWVTGPDGIWVISPAGEHLGVVRVPEPPNNLAWGGVDGRTLFVAAGGSIYAVPTLTTSPTAPRPPAPAAS